MVDLIIIVHFIVSFEILTYKINSVARAKKKED
ncbi:MAG: hypothetical protein ACJA1N_002394 [Saprospiraceae bacterium]